MSLKERLLKKQILFNEEKARALAAWIKDNEHDLREVLEQNVPVRKIQVEAIADLGENYPNDVNFEAALYFSLLQLEAVGANSGNFVNIPVVESVEDLKKIEAQKEQAKIEPFRVGNKKYYYVKYSHKNKEVELVKLTTSKKSVQEYFSKKNAKSFDAYGNYVPIDVIEIRFAKKEELERLGVIEAGQDVNEGNKE